jgi:hypothetical protein
VIALYRFPDQPNAHPMTNGISLGSMQLRIVSKHRTIDAVADYDVKVTLIQIHLNAVDGSWLQIQN